MNVPGTAFVRAQIESDCTDLEGLFRAQYRNVARAIFRILNDSGRAEELAVEAFIRWSKALPASGRNPEGWLYRTALRIGLDELRHRARRQRYEKLAQLFRPPLTPEQIHVTAQEREAVRDVLCRIAPGQAELLLLRHRGLSYEEMAAALNINPSSAGTLLRRAQVAFRKEYVRRYGEK